MTMKSEIDIQYETFIEAIDKFISDAATVPRNGTIMRGSDDTILIVFDPRTTKKEMYDDIVAVETMINKIEEWPQVGPFEGVPMGPYGWIDDGTGDYVYFWSEGPLLRDEHGNTINPDYEPILKSNPFGWYRDPFHIEVNKLVNSARGLLPENAHISAWDGTVQIGFDSGTPSDVIYNTLNQTSNLWYKNAPAELSDSKKAMALIVGHTDDEFFPDHVSFWTEDGKLRTLRGDVITPSSSPIDHRYLGWHLYFSDTDRWSDDLSDRVIELFRSHNQTIDHNDLSHVQAYMDRLEASGDLPDATAWDELLDTARQDMVYRQEKEGFGGNFPTIRTISSFDDIRPDDLPQRDPIDTIELPRYGETVRDPIDNLDLPTVSGGSGLAPDLDDLRSEIDRFKEERPRISRDPKEEYRGTSRDSGYRQRGGRGRLR